MCIIYKYSNIDKLGLSAQKLLLLKVDRNMCGNCCHVFPTDLSIKVVAA